MLKRFFVAVLLLAGLLAPQWLHAQATNCGDAYLAPFCDGIAQYPASFDGTGSGSGPQAPVGPNYDCLGTQGNPTYFSLTIDQAGSINFTLDNTSNVDIDFILWGPFADAGAAQQACDSMGNGGIWSGVADCSYSASAQELVTITNAQVGEVYILMVTNYANVATNIFSTSNTGSGGVACACDIPYTIDTLPALAGNQGVLTDTTGGIAQFVVCPNTTLGFALQASSNLRDTLDLYAPFTTIDDAFTNYTIVDINPNAPAFYDSLVIFSLLTPTTSEIGVNRFSVGLRNDLYTGGLTDSTCFDFANIEVIVPGLRLNDRNVCAGETFSVTLDSIPSTSAGSSSYTWRQISGLPVTFSNPNGRSTQITLPVVQATSSSDSIVIVVDYAYGALCPMTDTMILRLADQSVTAMAMPAAICSGDTAQLMASLQDTLSPSICDQYNVTTIPFLPQQTTGGTAVTAFNPTSGIFTAADEGISNGLPIGFPFDFYCNTYNRFYIHTNGFITFDSIPVTGTFTGSTLPSNAVPNNLIALGWEDLDVSNGGSINYYTTGVAPNRILVINFNSIQSFFIGAAVTAQVLLYEGTNNIELHITSNTLPISTIGIEDRTGTIAHYPSAFTATQGQAFGPTSNTAYRFLPVISGPFFSWTPGASLDDNTLANPNAYPGSTTVYTLSVADGMCRYEDTTQVTVISNYPAPVLTCGTATDSSLNVTWSSIALPASGFYEYSLDGGLTWINIGANLSVAIPGLMPGTSYNILVRGNDGTGGICTLSPTGSATCSTSQINCGNFPNLAISLSNTSLACFGDSTACITATVTGGTGNPANYFWSTGQLDTNQICNLGAGTYSLTVTDTIPTIGTPTVAIAYAEAFDGVSNWTLNVPTGTNGRDNNFWTISSNEAGNPVGACGNAGGPNQTLHITSVFNPTGGAAYDAGGLCPFLFCPETNMRAESPAFSTTGLVNLTLTFNYIANGDGLIDNASVVVNDGTGWQVLNNSIKSNTCGGGQGEWSRFSATLPASFSNNPNIQVGINWTNNDDGIGSDPSVAIDSVRVLGLQFVGVPVVCLDTQSITITEPTPVVAQLDTVIDVSCSGATDGLVAVSATGGTPGYTYNWNTSANTDTLTNLMNGVYTVTITDAAGCTDSLQAIVNAVNPIVVTIDNVINNGCTGQPNGSIAITVIGGVAPFSYLWSNNSTNQDLINVSEGTYTITVTDANGCFVTTQATITPTLSLNLSSTVTGPNCAGDSAMVTITPTSGSGNYAYDWGTASGSTTNTAMVIAGNFIVTITDATNGCVETDTFTIVEPSALVVTLGSITNIPCGGVANSGAIDVQTTGGTPTYTYSWDNSATTEDLTGLSAGTYSLTVTDANGCIDTLGPLAITESTGITVTINGSNLTLGCDQQPIGTLTAQATGGTGISFQWSNGDTSATISGLGAATYTVVASNADGCVDSLSETIVAPALPTLNAYVQNPGTKRDTIALNTATPIGAGSTGFSYQWTGTADPSTGNPAIANPNAGTTTATPDPEGEYRYIVTASATTNDTTCSVMDTVYIVVQPPFLGIPDAFTPNGDGTNDLFRPVYLSDGEIMEFRVFNRWGQEVYTGEQNADAGWDGTYQGVPQPSDVYLYTITFRRASEPNGRTIKGEMTLIR